MIEKGTGISMRLQTLQKELESGKRESLQRFWKEVKEQGAPLVEEIESDNGHRLATFLWQADEKLKDVSLISLMTNPTEYPMTHLPDTDLWYLSLQLPSDLRTTYQFFLLPWAKNCPDPFNPNIFAFYTEKEDPTDIKLTRSVLELPDAPSQPWIEPQENVAKGKVQIHTMESKILGNERRVWVYTPHGYKPGTDEPYPLLVLFDGWAYAYLMPTFTILDNLIAAGEIPPIVAVLPDSLDAEIRMKELVYYQPFNTFLVTEFLPWVLTQYAVTSNPQETVIGGSSAGGLAAAYAALKHPEVFGNILSQSGAFSLSPAWEADYGWLARQYGLGPELPLKFHLDVGTLEENSFHELRGRPSTLKGNHRVRDALVKKDYPVHYTEFSGGHDYINWQGTLGDGLKFLLG